MEDRYSLVEEFYTNATRLGEATSLADKVLYRQMIDNILDEWNQGTTTEFEPLVELGSE